MTDREMFVNWPMCWNVLPFWLKIATRSPQRKYAFSSLQKLEVMYLTLGTKESVNLQSIFRMMNSLDEWTKSRASTSALQEKGTAP